MKGNIRKIVSAILAVMMVFSISAMAGCSIINKIIPGQESQQPVEVSITLDKTSISLEEGETATIIATVTGSESAVEWSSSNPAKATVENGVVTAVEAGTTTITAKVGDKTATCEVVVSEVVLPVITLNVSSTQIYKGQTLNLNGVVTMGEDIVDDAVITYESSNEAVITIDANGVVTGISKGTADITANCTYNGKVATQKTISVSVQNLIIVSLLTEDGQALKTGETLALEAMVSVDGESVENAEIAFSVNSEAASISGNTLKALSANEEIVISASYTLDGEVYSDSIIASIEYTSIFNSAIELAAEENQGTLFIETDKNIASATLNGATVELTAEEGGYIVDAALLDGASFVQEIILTDTEGVAYLATIQTISKGDVASVIGVRPEEAYTATKQIDVVAAGRTGLVLVQGANYQNWRNAYTVLGLAAAREAGADYLAFDVYFIPGDQQFLAITNSSTTFVNMTVGQPVESDDVAVYALDGSASNFVAGEWVTVVMKLENYGLQCEGYASGGFNAYFANVRYMTADGFACFTEGKVAVPEIVIPASVDLSLDLAIANPGADYRLTRAAASDTYLDKTAIKFTGTNEALWRNNMLINVAQYSIDYKWVLVDFYFNSDDVRFNVAASINNYVALTMGSHCTNGSFYVVEEIDGKYYSVPAQKSAWITVAFKISDLANNYINAIMLGAVDTYVANMRAVQDTILDEVVEVSNTIDNSNIYVFDYSSSGVAPMTRTDNATAYGRSDLVQLVGAANGTWHNTFMVSGLTGIKDLKAAGYRYLAVDILFNSQGVAGSNPGFFYPANEVTSVALDGAPSNESVKLFGIDHQPLATLANNTWATYVFDLSLTERDNIQAYAVGACHWYVSDSFAMTEAEFAAWQVAPTTAEVDTIAMAYKNMNQTLVDGIGGRNGVVQCNGTAAWYDNVVFLPIVQNPNSTYNTFSIDVYLTAETGLYFYFTSGTADAITYGTESAVDGIAIVDANGEAAALTTGTWLTIKLDLTKMGYASPQMFPTLTGQAICLDNAYLA